MVRLWNAPAYYFVYPAVITVCSRMTGEGGAGFSAREGGIRIKYLVQYIHGSSR